MGGNADRSLATSFVVGAVLLCAGTGVGAVVFAVNLANKGGPRGDYAIAAAISLAAAALAFSALVTALLRR